MTEFTEQENNIIEAYSHEMYLEQPVEIMECLILVRCKEIVGPWKPWGNRRDTLNILVRKIFTEALSQQMKNKQESAERWDNKKKIRYEEYLQSAFIRSKYDLKCDLKWEEEESHPYFKNITLTYDEWCHKLASAEYGRYKGLIETMKGTSLETSFMARM